MSPSTTSGTPSQASGTIAIVGAGPGIGQAVARRFGREGYRVALVARNAEQLAARQAELAQDGITASAFPADAADPPSLTAAFGEITRTFGGPDVLVYNTAGAAGGGVTPVREVTADSAVDAFTVTVVGAVTAVRAVLPGLLERGSGTLLFTSGLSAVHPLPFLGNVGIAVAGLRNYVLALAEDLDGSGVHVGHVPIGAFVSPDSVASPEIVAETHWRLHAERATHEIVLGDLATVRAAISALTST